jgi:hypothetical protein
MSEVTVDGQWPTGAVRPVVDRSLDGRSKASPPLRAKPRSEKKNQRPRLARRQSRLRTPGEAAGALKPGTTETGTEASFFIRSEVFERIAVKSLRIGEAGRLAFLDVSEGTEGGWGAAVALPCPIGPFPWGLWPFDAKRAGEPRKPNAKE